MTQTYEEYVKSCEEFERNIPPDTAKVFIEKWDSLPTILTKEEWVKVQEARQ